MSKDQLESFQKPPAHTSVPNKDISVLGMGPWYLGFKNPSGNSDA